MEESLGLEDNRAHKLAILSKVGKYAGGKEFLLAKVKMGRSVSGFLYLCLKSGSQECLDYLKPGVSGALLGKQTPRWRYKPQCQYDGKHIFLKSEHYATLI